jgi:PAS domain S-box-containing protein
MAETLTDVMLEHIPDAILRLDNFGSIQYCNPAVQTLTGYAETELLGKPFYFLNQNQTDNIKGSYDLNVAVANGKLVSQGWYLTRDGVKYWAETTLSVIYDAAEKQTGFVWIIRDGSERKQNEITLRRSEERYRLLVEGIKDYLIYMLDTEGHIITWNEGAQQLTGYLSSEIIGKHFSIFYNPNDLASDKPALELETARRAGKYEEEGWRVKKNGSVFRASIVLTAVYNDENTLIGFSKIIMDLTERNIEESALRQSEERYRLLVEQAADYGIFMLDDKGRIVSWNEGAKKIKGYDSSEVIGKYFSLFYPQEDIYNGKPAHELTVARQTGKYEEEGWRLRKDGSRFWANVIITAVYNSNGALVGFSKVTRDLTERKKSEQEAVASAEKYRQVAKEMEVINAELTNTNHELEQFTSIVSHDLQEPLRTVKSFLYLINQKVDKEQVVDIKPYVTKSILAANRMKELIENVLNYSQVSKVQISNVTHSFDQIFDHVLQNLKGTLDEIGATFRFEGCEGKMINGDQVQLIQLFQNLISNGIKFTDGKQPEIKIAYNDDAGYVLFSVSDNGIGMDSDSRLKIFDPFRRLHAARNYPGAGMGLAICKKVVERHQGRIWVESQPGFGSIFYFTLWETKSKKSIR